MNLTGIKKIFILLTLFHYTNCNSQTPSQQTMNTNSQPKLVNREPSVAGQFYPDKRDDLENMLNTMFIKAEKKKSENVLAIVCPHAGYVFSGTVAATSFNQIDEKKNYKDIFIIGSSHRVAFDGATIYCKGNFITPLGTVNVDITLAQKLINENKIFNFNADAHSGEHCLEVELPFLQHIMKHEYKIIPIVIGTQDTNICKEIAKVLKPYFNNENLFIISSDFSHYPSYKDAEKIDNITADAITTNEPEKLINALKNNSSKNINGLATSLCGWTSVLTMLYMTKDNNNISIEKISYKNSGDSEFGEKDNVVGYYSIAVTEKNKKLKEEEIFNFNESDKKDLLNIARQTLTEYIRNQKAPKFNSEVYSENIKQNLGAFVTLKENGVLRGCIGNFTADKPLYKIVEDMTIAASTEDTRFEPVESEEINKISIEISILSPLKKIKSIDEIVLGKHGIYIMKGRMGGTFLPQVATETKWNKEEFLGHCSKDKAGIGYYGWKDKDADIYIYEAYMINE